MEKIELNKPGYGTYAVLKGGKEIIKFNDNSDIATDKESNAIPVVP